jgi:outer membrane protein OmpA-like peptidoglycan-associated protein
VNAKIVLKNIFFGTNQAELKPESIIELDKVVELLAENPTLRIEIDGHTDATGTAAANMALSNNRAKAVVNYLLSKGVALRRLVAKGFGSTQPVADNNTEAGRAQNRRTELKVLAK